MRQVQTILYNIRTAAKKLVEKCEENGTDILIIGKELSVLSRSIGSSDSLLSLDIGNMTNSSRELSLLYPHLGLVAQTCSQMVKKYKFIILNFYKGICPFSQGSYISHPLLCLNSGVFCKEHHSGYV